VAKKVRTPAPPKRPVQAPQRRQPKRTPTTQGGNLWSIIAILALVTAAAVGAALYFALRGNGGGSSQTQTAHNYNTLPGIRRTKPPWPVDYAYLTDNLIPLGLDTGTSHNGLALHFHDHLSIFINGKKVTVPALIGINDDSYLTEIHTHATDGIVHVESTHNGKTFTLGQFFAEWPLFLNAECIGAECGLKWYVNGKQQTGNPANLVLKPHQVIAIVVGKAPKKIPFTYAWNGL